MWSGGSGFSVASEEGFQELGGFFGQDAGDDVEAVVEAWVGAELIEGACAAHFGVWGAVDQALDAGVDQGAGAHGTGLKGDGQGAVLEAPGAQFACGFAEGEDFGVGGGVLKRFAEVVGLGQDFVAAVDHGADGNFASGGGFFGLGQSTGHHEVVQVHRGGRGSG